MRKNKTPITSTIRPFWIKLRETSDLIGRAFQEFLAVPSLVIFLFVFLAIGVYIFERSEYQLYSPLRTFLQERVFADASATNSLLSTIAGSIITVTSITTTLLLLIVQQSASTMSSQVFDQYLRRRSNQFYFGFFIGLALYTLITLATVDEPFNPILAATLAFLLTVIALFILILIFYSTIHQMRPPVIIQAIHDHTLHARNLQRELLSQTKRSSTFDAPEEYEVRSETHGFVTGININLLSKALKEVDGACEIILKVSIGTYAVYQDLLAVIKMEHLDNIESIEKKIRSAIHLERSRNIQSDPAYGISQLEVIAWTSTSPAKSNLAPGLQVVFSLRDLLARWGESETVPENDEPLPIVYNDEVLHNLITAFESLAIVASLSREHQILTEIFNAYAKSLDRLQDSWQEYIGESVLRILPTLSEYILSRNLELSTINLINAFTEVDKSNVATRLQEAMVDLRKQMRT